MSFTDPVFPPPEPTFLWNHPVVLHAVGAETTDDEGRWRYTDGAQTPVTGYLSPPDPRLERRAAADAQRVDAVLLVPRDVDVPWPCYLEVASAAVPAALRGWYEVQPPRPNPSHTRLLLTRLEGDPRPSRAP